MHSPIVSTGKRRTPQGHRSIPLWAFGISVLRSPLDRRQSSGRSPRHPFLGFPHSILPRIKSRPGSPQHAGFDILRRHSPVLPLRMNSVRRARSRQERFALDFMLSVGSRTGDCASFTPVFGNLTQGTAYCVCRSQSNRIGTQVDKFTMRYRVFNRSRQRAAKGPATIIATGGKR